MDRERQEVFRHISKILGAAYYLAGGTALALQLRHRESFDFDLFRNAEIKLPVKQKVFKGLKGYPLKTLVDTADELSVVLKNEIKLSLINYFWDPLFPLLKIPGIIPLLSIKDIAATKAYALGRRGSYRDYFDLYVIIKSGHAALPDIIKWCRKKYGEVFSERMFLEQLTYMDDMESGEKLKFIDEQYISPKDIVKFFKSKIRKL